jgi:dienelactone hydrolase
VWRYRLACVAFDRQEWIRVMELLTPLAVISRTSDPDVMEMLGQAAAKLGAERRLRPMLLHRISERDRIEDELTAGLGGRRVHFDARDGFPLSGTLLAPPRATRPRCAVVLMAPGDTLALYDTLAVGLRRLGFAVMLAEVRGSGRAVAPGCPSPDAWRGRVSTLRSAVAGDVRVALATLAREAGGDSTRYLVVGVGATAPIAVQAAALDPRVRALLLVSPVAAPVDRGPLRALLARVKRPVYFQTGPEDFTTWDLIDALYGACDPRASRVADSDKPGNFAALFRRDPRILERLRRWLDETLPPRAAPRATRPAPPRRG